MELNNNTNPALEQIPSPAFLVRDGKVAAANLSAQNRQFVVGTQIDEMLETGKEEYAALSDGQLSLVLCCNNISYDTTAIRQGQETLFLIASEYDRPELKALSLAAQYLREPLSNAMSSTDQLMPLLAEQPDAVYRQLLQVSQSLYRLQRAIGNMSDTAKYQSLHAVMELRDAVQILSEILSKASALLEAAGKKLEYSLPGVSVYTMVNAEVLERGVLNLISNAAKEAKDNLIRVAVTKTDKSLCITVRNSCDAFASTNMIDRYLRQPDLEAGQNGIGLGISIIRSCAYTHGGTLLTQLIDPQNVKITMSLKIQSSSDNVLRTPVALPFDYAGGYDHALIELSDVLPPDAYSQK